MKRKILIQLLSDSDIENPSEFDGAWTLYSFSNRHASYRSPEEFFPDGKPTLAIRRKLEVGTAFLLSYYEHSGCVWSLRGEGPQCRWDSVDCAGILIWEHPVKDMGAKSKEDRAKDAACFLRTYTDWANGNGYGYSIEEEIEQPCGHVERKDVSSCFGFYGSDVEYMASQCREEIPAGATVEISGEASYLADSHDFGQGR